MKQSYLLPFLSVLLLVSVAADTEPLLGGFTPLRDPNDPHVRELGQFAVTEYNKQSNATLTFLNVVKGESQLTAGMNYHLILRAKDGNATNEYDADVWEDLSNAKGLASFKLVK